MFVRILSSSIAAASLATAAPAFADDTTLYSSGEGISSLDLRETRSSSWIVSATPAFPDDIVLYSSGDGLSSLDRPRGSPIQVHERVAVKTPAEGAQVRAAHAAVSSEPRSERSLGADPFNRSMDSGG